MTQYRRQHWVPRSYLRRFTVAGERLHVFDKVTGREFPSNPMDVARGAFFNDAFLRDEQGAMPPDVPAALFEQQFEIWEQALTDMTVVALRVAGGGSASLEERFTMATAVAVQLVRTSAFRKRLVEGVRGTLEEELNAFVADRMPEFAAKYRAELTFPRGWDSALHAEFMWQSGQIPELATDLCFYIWRIGVNGTAIPLCTSDSPVFPCVHDAAQPVATPSLPRTRDIVRAVVLHGRPIHGLELVFPLTPRLALLMYHPGYFEHMQPAQGRPIQLSEERVAHFNALQFLYAERQVFAPDAAVLRRVRALTATYTAVDR